MLSWRRRTSRLAGYRAISSGLVSGNSGRWRMASAGRPDGLGIAIGKTLASLLSTPSNSISSYGSNLARPRRRQWNRSSETARAMRGPSGERAVYVMTYRRSGSTKVIRGSSRPPRTRRAALVVLHGLESRPQPLDPDRITDIIEPNPGHPDARVVTLRHEPREQVEPTVETANRSRIQDALSLDRIAGFGLHDPAQAAHPEAARHVAFTRVAPAAAQVRGTQGSS